MFLRFFDNLRTAKLPVSLREYLTLLEAMEKGVVMYDVEGFYYLARAALVKDERNIDRFDQVFAHSFKGMEEISTDQMLEQVDLPEEWLRKQMEKHLTPEEMKEIEALGGFEKLMEALREVLEKLAAEGMGQELLDELAETAGMNREALEEQIRREIGAAIARPIW